MLGMRISALRRQKNWSQKELAERMGVRPSTIGMYEQGRREPDCAGLVRLAELFGVTTDYLLTGVAADGRDDAALRALWAQIRERSGRSEKRSWHSCWRRRLARRIDGGLLLW